MNRSLTKIFSRFIIPGLFGAAMGALEAIVVVYLRQIYYPQGFTFPLNMLSPSMLAVEWLREAATIVMLAAVGIMAGSNRLARFAWFLYTFAVWDIFYYVWLKLLLDWPSSLLTWDVLFLIPVPWIGPVLAPLIASLTMIVLGGGVILLEEKGYAVKIKFPEWILICSGALAILAGFIWDFSGIIVREFLAYGFAALGPDGHVYELISRYNPTRFNWYFFMLGEIIITYALVLIVRRTLKQLPD